MLVVHGHPRAYIPRYGKPSPYHACHPGPARVEPRCRVRRAAVNVILDIGRWPLSTVIAVHQGDGVGLRVYKDGDAVPGKARVGRSTPPPSRPGGHASGRAAIARIAPGGERYTSVPPGHHACRSLARVERAARWRRRAVPLVAGTASTAIVVGSRGERDEVVTSPIRRQARASRRPRASWVTSGRRRLARRACRRPRGRLARGRRLPAGARRGLAPEDGPRPGRSSCRSPCRRLVAAALTAYLALPGPDVAPSPPGRDSARRLPHVAIEPLTEPRRPAPPLEYRSRGSGAGPGRSDRRLRVSSRFSSARPGRGGSTPVAGPVSPDEP